MSFDLNMQIRTITSRPLSIDFSKLIENWTLKEIELYAEKRQ